MSSAVVRARCWFAVAAAGMAVVACSGGGADGDGVPVTMSLSAAVATPSQVDLSWSAHPDPVTGYDVVRNGAAAWPTHLGGTSFSDHHLDPDTRYCYRVFAVVFPVGVVGGSNEACVRTLATTGWAVSVIDAAGGRFVSLARGAGDTLHVSYHDGASQSLKYATNASGSWVTSTLATGGAGFGGTSIALHTDGSVHISYNDYTAATGAAGLAYATNASGAWVAATVDAAGGWATSLRLDPTGNAHISYSRGAPNHDLRYATNASGAWVTTFITGFSNNIQRTSLALDSAAAAHIGYAVGNGACAIRYATNAPAPWTDSLVAGAARCGVALALDTMDKAHLGYPTSSELVHATNATGAWVSSTVDQFNAVPGSDASIAIDTADKIHLAYQDHNSDLKYATDAPGTWATFWIDSRGDVGSANALTVDAGTVDIVYLDATRQALNHARSP